ncbi:MAG: RDD family protein [Nocardioides sp.]
MNSENTAFHSAAPSAGPPTGDWPREYAEVGQRITALLIDYGVGLLMVVPLYISQGAYILSFGQSSGALLSMLIFGLGSLALGLYQWHLTAVYGYTIGKKATGISVLDADTGLPIGWGRAFLRNLVLGLLGLPMGLLQLAQIFIIKASPTRQGWHDSAVRSVVVKGLPLAPVPEPTVPSAQDTPDLPGPLSGNAPSSSLASQPGTYAPPALSLGDGTGSLPLTGFPAPPPPPPPPVVGAAPVPLDVPPPSVGAIPLPPITLPPPPPLGSSEITMVSSPRPLVRWQLTGHQVIPIEGEVLVGRDPSTTAHPNASVVRVEDMGMSMSKTHALLRAAGGTLTVEDLDSTNGVFVVQDGVEQAIGRRMPTVLKSGDTVFFGDVEFTVEHSA